MPTHRPGHNAERRTAKNTSPPAPVALHASGAADRCDRRTAFWAGEPGRVWGIGKPSRRPVAFFRPRRALCRRPRHDTAPERHATGTERLSEWRNHTLRSGPPANNVFRAAYFWRLCRYFPFDPLAVILLCGMDLAAFRHSLRRTAPFSRDYGRFYNGRLVRTVPIGDEPVLCLCRRPAHHAAAAVPAYDALPA